MSWYIGIDLGTTNSAICSYDGDEVRIWKSPDQTDVTPSAIYVDRRGNRFYGARAYRQAPRDPKNAATLFKRYMGTSTKLTLEAAGLTLTPEECSAEILKVLYAYLPEEIRKDPETATVITVPAAFNQMKKDATLQAAELAGLGKVALMQEPVAAIMSIMRKSKSEGIFLVYDLGGGTFDVSIAENTGGKVRLLAHGGVEMCGGRDIDRLVFNHFVLPWLRKNFSLPDDLVTNPKYRQFCRFAQYEAEQAKIKLSSADTVTIALTEDNARMEDEAGEELYLDIELHRQEVSELMEDLIQETITATRETMEKAGINANDVEKIVFVGGPTNYKPLRDRVSFELSIPANIDVNPMTAVAEGASIFAESIDWSTEAHGRKTNNETVSTSLDLELKYTARTPDSSAKLMCVAGDIPEGCTIQLTSLDTGWSSGEASLQNKLVLTLPLARNGENNFSVSVKNRYGSEMDIGVKRITITRTLATISAIPASNSIGVEVIDKLGGQATLEFLVHEGDPLPKRGTITFRAAQPLRAGSNESINIKLWEGAILSPITDNRFIGVLKILGTDIEYGMVPTGAEIECEYEMSDSGAIRLEASIPSIGASFGNRNFYSRQEGQIDLTDVEGIADQGRSLRERIRDMTSKVQDERLNQAAEKAERAARLDSMDENDPEEVQKSYNELLEAKKLIYRARRDNLKVMRQSELDSCVENYNRSVRKYASAAEQQVFDNQARTAQRSIDRNDNDFENILSAMKTESGNVLVRQDWFIVDMYRYFISNPRLFSDRGRFEELKRLGNQALAGNDMRQVRNVVAELISLRIPTETGEAMFDNANILKG